MYHVSGRQSDPSGGISAFRGAVSNEDVDTMDFGVPADKFQVRDDGVSETPQQQQNNTNNHLVAQTAITPNKNDENGKNEDL